MRKKERKVDGFWYEIVSERQLSFLLFVVVWHFLSCASFSVLHFVLPVCDSSRVNFDVCLDFCLLC